MGFAPEEWFVELAKAQGKRTRYMKKWKRSSDWPEYVGELPLTRVGGFV